MPRATPRESVNELWTPGGGSRVKLPAAGRKVRATLAPATGLFAPSRTSTAKVSAIVLTITDWPSPCTVTIEAGSAEIAVAVKVTVLQPQRRVAVTESVPSVPSVYATLAFPD